MAYLSSMRGFVAICVVLAWASSIMGQLAFPLSIEGSLSAGTTFNRGSVLGTAVAGQVITVTEAKPARSYHWSAGLGYHIASKHSIWLRLGVNDPASLISGTTQASSDDFGVTYPVVPYKDFRQAYKTKVIRIEYEYAKEYGLGKLLFSLGAQRQFDFTLADILFASQSFHPTTYGGTASLGYAYPIGDGFEVTGRLRVINTFRSKGDAYYPDNDLDFSPLQVLAELGVRYSLFPKVNILKEEVLSQS